ncbi:Gfo/Idh/MocA family protein [Caballeronia sordidicola]|jgi:phthalate 4,5-cis-dihydrodiol dehydrogenase|uniref:Gfo/Idh/MocA family protein n=1 Tax=Caballeronia sordidicola TaxID=196367 RepID=UPI0004D00EF4|nr:Gfo/Idh/MocA family oxidoreductase [Caballeronia sordidicola]
MDRLRFGICGLGFAGSVLMAPAMKRHPSAEIVAACDPNAETRAAFGRDYGIATYDSLLPMLDNTDLDAVYIASPHQYHCEQVVLAAERGKHIIVEKPLTLSEDDAQRMVDAVERHKVQIVVGTSRSHDPVVKTMRDIVRSGELGRLAMINAWNYTDYLYRPRRPEELDTSKGGGILFSQLPHQLDVIKTIANAPIVSVRAGSGKLDPQRPTEGHCAAFVTLSNGVFATLAYSGYDHFDSDELQFWIAESGREKRPNHGGARKLLVELTPAEEASFKTQRLGYGGPVARNYAATEANRKQPHFGIVIATCERGDLRPCPDGVLIYGDDGPRTVPAHVGRGAYGQGDTIDELYDALVGTQPTLRDAAFGRNTVLACLAVLQSSKTGREVPVLP